MLVIQLLFALVADPSWTRSVQLQPEGDISLPAHCEHAAMVAAEAWIETHPGWRTVRLGCGREEHRT